MARGQQLSLRLPVEMVDGLREVAHRRRVSREQLLRDLLADLIRSEGLPLCTFCEPKPNNDCPGSGLCHCGCGQPAGDAKFVGNHHSLPFRQA